MTEFITGIIVGFIVAAVGLHARLDNFHEEAVQHGAARYNVYDEFEWITEENTPVNWRLNW